MFDYWHVFSFTSSFIYTNLFSFFSFQYYEMSYGLNVEMHKQVRNRVDSISSGNYLMIISFNINNITKPTKCEWKKNYSTSPLFFSLELLNYLIQISDDICFSTFEFVFFLQLKVENFSNANESEGSKLS